MQFDIRGAQIQKAFSSSRFIALNCRKPGKSFTLYLGRGNHYEGIWLSELKLDSQLRIIDQFLEYIRKFLVSAVIESIELNDKDRIIYINYFKYGKVNTFSLFYKGRELYFANKYYNLDKKNYETYCSWSSQKRDHISSDIFEELGVEDLNKEKENNIVEIGVLLDRELSDARKIFKKDNKKLKRKIDNINNDLMKIKNFHKLYEFVESQPDLSKLDEKIRIHGVRFSFKEKDHYKRRDQIYSKAKKLKKIKPHMLNRLEQAKDDLIKIEKSDRVKNNLSILKPIIKTIKKLNKSKVENGYIVKNIENLAVAIGKSSQGNDQMRKEWAKKDDWWFHLDNETSSHIIVKGSIDDILSKIESIALLMKEESKLNSNEVNLIYTQVKNLKGNKGTAGSVIYKKIKYIRVNL